MSPYHLPTELTLGRLLLIIRRRKITAWIVRASQLGLMLTNLNKTRVKMKRYFTESPLFHRNGDEEASQQSENSEQAYATSLKQSRPDRTQSFAVIL